MMVKIIKEHLKGQGLDTIGGKKQVLVNRMIDDVLNNAFLVENQNGEVPDNFSGSGFNEGAYCNYLNPEDHSKIINKASQNIVGLQFRAAAVPEAESSSHNAPKRNYTQTLFVLPLSNTYLNQISIVEVGW